jgi:hypothetical protein
MPSGCGHIHTNSTSITIYSHRDQLIISRQDYARASTAPGERVHIEFLILPRRGGLRRGTPMRKSRPDWVRFADRLH